MVLIGDTSHAVGNASRVEESHKGTDEEVKQEGEKGRALYSSRVQLDTC